MDYAYKRPEGKLYKVSIKECIQGKLLEAEGHTFYRRSRRVREKG